MREQEGRNAGAVIGAREVLFLPYIDPEASDGVLHAIDATLEEFSASIQEVMSRLRPDVVITHGTNGEYGHPQHIFTQHATFYALRSLQPWRPREVLTWCADYPDPEVPAEVDQDDPANILMDIRPWAALKLAAFQEHRSQYYPVISTQKASTLHCFSQFNSLEDFHPHH